MLNMPSCISMCIVIVRCVDICEIFGCVVTLTTTIDIVVCRIATKIATVTMFGVSCAIIYPMPLTWVLVITV